jgi:hypothetical protein
MQNVNLFWAYWPAITKIISAKHDEAGTGAALTYLFVFPTRKYAGVQLLAPLVLRYLENVC